jgi:hypothetical protein
MQQLLKEFTTDDGCVTFVMHPRTTIDIEIAQSQLDSTLPDLSGFGENIQNLAFAYKLVLAHTEDIRFNGVDQESEWHDFKQWWESRNHADELSRWAEFRGTFGRDEINIWVDAFDATRSKNRKAPETLHPGAEQRAATDPDFLEGDSETSVNGGDSSGKSPAPKKPSKRNVSASETAALNAS